MKIFPPIREILRPAHPSASKPVAASTAKGQPKLTITLTLAGCACLGVLGWTFAGNERTGVNSAKLINVTAENCSSLVKGTVGGETVPSGCSPFAIKAGPSLAGSTPADRTDLPMRDARLTASDHAIQAPTALKPSLWQPSTPSLAIKNNDRDNAATSLLPSKP